MSDGGSVNGEDCGMKQSAAASTRGLLRPLTRSSSRSRPQCNWPVEDYPARLCRGWAGQKWPSPHLRYWGPCGASSRHARRTKPPPPGHHHHLPTKQRPKMFCVRFGHFPEGLPQTPAASGQTSSNNWLAVVGWAASRLLTYEHAKWWPGPLWTSSPNSFVYDDPSKLTQYGLSAQLGKAALAAWYARAGSDAQCRLHAYGVDGSAAVLGLTPSYTLDTTLCRSDFLAHVGSHLGVDVCRGGPAVSVAKPWTARDITLQAAIIWPYITVYGI